MMKSFLLVFLGGGFGSVFRYLLSLKLNNIDSTIPYGTFWANMFGSLLIGFLFGLMTKSGHLSDNTTLFLATGFCGGLTTFSTFALENQQFLSMGYFMQAFTYLLITFVVGLTAVFAGLYLSKLI